MRSGPMVPSILIAAALAASPALAQGPREAETPLSSYRSESCGFRLDLPPSWDPQRWSARELKDSEARVLHPLAGRAVKLVYLPAASAEPPCTLLTVLLFDRMAYYQAPVHLVPSPSLLLAETADRVLFGDVPARNPFEPGSSDAMTFEAMRVTVGDLRKALSLLDGSPVADEGEAARELVTGTVISRQPVYLFSGDVLEVFLLDLSRADAPAEVIGSFRADSLSQLPVDFVLSYEASSILPSGTYVLAARILRDGRLRFVSESRQPVITNGHPRHAKILVVPAERRP